MAESISSFHPKKWVFAIGMTILLILGVQPAASQQSSVQKLATIDWLYSPSFSTDGQYLVFASYASNLVEEDHNPASDIFLRNQSTGTISLISINSHGVQGSGWSYQPMISADGRYVAFTSLASNLVSKYALADTNGLADIYLHDRNTRTTQRISVSSDGSQAHGWSDDPAISGDGRFVVFSSTASDLVADDTNSAKDIFLYDRLEDSVRRVSISSADAQANGNSLRAAISASGRYIAFLSHATNLTHESQPGVFLHDHVTAQTLRLPFPIQQVDSVPDFTSTFSSQLSISADGNRVVYASRDDRKLEIFAYDRAQDKIIFTHQINDPIPANAYGSLAAMSAGGRYLLYPSITPDQQLAFQVYDLESDRYTINLPDPIDNAHDTLPVEVNLSPNGNWIAFTIIEKISNPHEKDGTSLNLFERGAVDDQVAQLYGWVSDGLGHPIAGVTIAGTGHQTTRTDRDGNFVLTGLPSGSYKIAPSKKGYEFSPSAYRFTLPSRSSPNRGNLPLSAAFTANPLGVVEAARADIGMPYSLIRGCDSPFEPCGGPYQGFYSGDCTDLVMDAYRFGANFAIEKALQNDFLNNPRHYYYWHNTRNSQDMWRYFAYNGQVLAHDQPYLPGDIVFFDWENDGSMDHVAIVSEINRKGRPLKIIDATGYIANNPSGLAIELDWEPYHDGYAHGHARWNGTYSASKAENDIEFPILLIALDSPLIRMSLRDHRDRLVDAATHNLPGGVYQQFGASTIISVDRPQKNGDWFFIELNSPLAARYHLGIQMIYPGQIVEDQTFEAELSAQETKIISIELFEQDGIFQFKVHSPQ